MGWKGGWGEGSAGGRDAASPSSCLSSGRYRAGPSQKSPSPSPPPSSFFFKYQPITIPCSGASALRLGEVEGSEGLVGPKAQSPGGQMWFRLSSRTPRTRLERLSEAGCVAKW